MKYLGIVKRRGNQLTMPDAFDPTAREATYEAIQVGDAILLLAPPLDRERHQRIEALAREAIDDHRQSLEGLSG